MAEYRFLFHDLKTNLLVGEVPLAGVSYEPGLLLGDGPFSATLPRLSSGDAAGLDVLGATAPARRFLYVERDGVLVYAGIVWTRRYNSRAGAFTIAGSEPSSYLRRRRWTPANRSYVTVSDQTIFADLVNDAMSGYGSSIGLRATVAGGPGNLRTRTFLAGELNPIAQNVDALAEEAPGFEWANEVARPDPAGEPDVILAGAWPYRGRPAASSGLVWEYPGNVLEFDWPEDAGVTANLVWGLGQAAATNLDLSAYSWAVERISVEGYPLLEDVLTASQVRDAAHLQRLTDTDRLRRDAPTVLPVLKVSPSLFPAVGDYVTGDRFMAYLDDPRRFPEPWAGVLRLVSRKVTVDRAGVETVELTCLPWPSATL